MRAPRLSTKDRKTAYQAIDRFNAYHEWIPIGPMVDALKRVGLVVVQEDKTEWSGFCCGREGRASLPLAKADSKTGEFYEPLMNALCLTWYKMQSGRYEVVAYIS
jgi:hypothetical protein